MEKMFRAVVTVVPLTYPDEVQLEFREVVDDRVTDVFGKFDPESWLSARRRLILTEEDLDAAELPLSLGEPAKLGVQLIKLRDK